MNTKNGTTKLIPNGLETTFGNVVLGAKVEFNGSIGQKIDEPNGSRNKYGNSKNFLASKSSENLAASEVVRTTPYSLKDSPELRHL